MAIKIGHSSIDENGKIAGGALGDQTGKEVCTRAWYNGGWNIVLRPNSASLAEKSAQFVEAICANNNVGYDQYNRNSLYKLVSANGFNGSAVGKCECDCSSFMHTAAIAGGANIHYGTNGATTRTLRTVLGNSGYYTLLRESKYLTSDKYLKRGDILVKEGAHTIMALANGSGVVDPAPKPTPAGKEKINVTYAVRIEGGKILPEVKNLNDYAGIENKKITDVAIKVDKGSIKYQVHVLGGKWLPWVTGYNWNDHNNGYAGCKRPIDAIRIYYNTPASIANTSGYQEVIYRISPIGSGSYYDWQKVDVVNKAKGMDGYAGALGKAMDKLQIYID